MRRSRCGSQASGYAPDDPGRAASRRRRAWERFSRRGYGLANLAAEFGIQFEHHDPCEDAYAAGQIVLRAIGESRTSLEDWFVRATQPSGGGRGRHAIEGEEGGPLKWSRF